MAMNATAGMRALVATSLLASVCPIIANAGPRDAAPISYNHRTAVSQAPTVQPVNAPATPLYSPASGATPRLNPVASQDSWRGPVTQTGSGTLPAQRRQISFTYPGSVRPGASASLPSVQSAAQPASALANGVSSRAIVAASFGASSGMTAGHASLPLNGLAHVRVLSSGREVVVRITSRTSAASGNVMTLSPHAGEMLGLSQGQSADVEIEYLGAASGVAGEHLQDQATVAPPPAQPVSVPPAQRRAPVRDQRPQMADTSGLFVQIGSFTDFDHARSLAGKVTSGMRSDVKTVDLRGTTYHRVMVGPFRTRADADSARTRLSHQGYRDSFVTQG